MASGLFIGLTEAQLLAIRDKAVADITAGRVVTSYSDSGSSVSKSYALPAKEMLQEALWALSRLDPGTYGHRRKVIVTNWENRDAP